MYLTGIVLACIIGAWLAGAVFLSFRRSIGFRQAVLYLPLKLIFRIRDESLEASDGPAPTIYAISHQSQLDAALMISLLPDDTLHILDEKVARAAWLEPWREGARTITFKAQQVFVGRRLARRLRGKGRIAVYFPFDAEPDVKSFRLYRAVARIAVGADARIVPIYIRGSSHLPGAYAPADKTPRRLFPKLRVMALPARTLSELVAAAGPVGTTAANALFDYVAEARFRSMGRPKTLFHSIRSAAHLYGASRIAVEDMDGVKLTYRGLFTRARALSGRLVETGTAGDTVGLMLPNSTRAVVSFLALQSCGRVVAMMNHAAGPDSLAGAVRLGEIRTVVSSRAFVDRARLADEIAAIEKAGARILWIEEAEAGLTRFDRLASLVLWRARRLARKVDDPAVILFTPGTQSETRAVVLSHANLIANAAQIESRLMLSRGDLIFSILPLFNALGLTAGMILPLMKGVRFLLYPSPLHYRQIPQVAATRQPTILFGTDTFLAAYARTAQSGDFDSLRLVISGGEPLRATTRAAWHDRFGIDIIEGFGTTEAAPVITVNSLTHSRAGTVGRLLPGMKMRIEPIEGLAGGGGRLFIAGPNLALGTRSEGAAALEPLGRDGWFDTGDVVSVDREGYLTHLGRAARIAQGRDGPVALDAVERAAEAVWPQAEHAAVAITDATGALRIVLLTSQHDASLPTLRRRGKKLELPAAAHVGNIVTVNSLPLTGGGRIDYRKAGQMAGESLGRVSAA